ncbi:MAG TPA: hypothetical protein VMH38_01070 [Thermoplasmata archaeon]|nr:hypothetical protein [Thermoplasmata archaeon]
MTLSADDLLTVVEVGVILVGVAVAWFAYRQTPTGTVRPGPLVAGKGSPTPTSASPDPRRKK